MAAFIIIAGPTASGKSALALRIAQAFGGTVINADSMQIYRELPLLSAQPAPAAMTQAPHRLYGVLSAAEPCSVGRWRALAVDAIERSWVEGRLPLIVGGTGLYLRSLTQGLAEIPDIPSEIRRRARTLLEEEGIAAVRAALERDDPAMAERLKAGDSQRQLRALEVIWATGRSLSDWQAGPATPRLAARHATILLRPDRAVLAAACDRRFDAMIAAGALEEVRATVHLDPQLPAMKALGIPELRRHLAGEWDLGQAALKAKLATRQYAKRQLTWLNHQIVTDFCVDTQFSESMIGEIFPFVQNFLFDRREGSA